MDVEKRVLLDVFFFGTMDPWDWFLFTDPWMVEFYGKSVGRNIPIPWILWVPKEARYVESDPVTPWPGFNCGAKKEFEIWRIEGPLKWRKLFEAGEIYRISQNTTILGYLFIKFRLFVENGDIHCFSVRIELANLSCCWRPYYLGSIFLAIYSRI